MDGGYRFCFCILLACTVVFASCGKRSKEGLAMRALDDIADKRIGVVVGTIHDGYVKTNYPKAKLLYVDYTPDLGAALLNEKCDVIIHNEEVISFLMKKNPSIGILCMSVRSEKLAFGFNKNNPALRESFNAFLEEMRSSGELQEICMKWRHYFEETPPPVITGDGSGMTLRFGTTGVDIPCSSVRDGQPAGYDVEIIYKFASRHNMKVEIQRIPFGGLIAALSSGKVDVIGNGMVITEERAKQISFSDSYFDKKINVAALKRNIVSSPEQANPRLTIHGSDSSPAVSASEPGTEDSLSDSGADLSSKSFLKTVADSFKNNIVAEKRYKIILRGLSTTLVITFFTVLFGTVWGGVICFLSMSRREIWRRVGEFYVTILVGTPVLVFLMIMFYVVFAKVAISPTVVAIVALALAFGAYVSSIYKASIGTVDKGQIEAGIAIGFTGWGVFANITFPQALQVALPLYKGEVISMLKTTAIVGYIAVEDLTKAGDIIRSRTFDAFFPLIMVALIYFVIAWLLSFVLTRLSQASDYRRKRVSLRNQKKTSPIDTSRR